MHELDILTKRKKAFEVEPENDKTFLACVGLISKFATGFVGDVSSRCKIIFAKPSIAPKMSWCNYYRWHRYF